MSEGQHFSGFALESIHLQQTAPMRFKHRFPARMNRQLVVDILDVGLHGANR